MKKPTDSARVKALRGEITALRRLEKQVAEQAKLIAALERSERLRDFARACRKNS